VVLFGPLAQDVSEFVGVEEASVLANMCCLARCFVLLLSVHFYNILYYLMVFSFFIKLPLKNKIAKQPELEKNTTFSTPAN
jgi:hypothetical protein